MKRLNTYSEKIDIEQDGLIVRGWRKRCPICGKVYETTSRGQKYCSDACLKKATKRRKKQQKEYDKTKDIVRLSARSHALAVETLEQLVRLGYREKECDCCHSTENLQVHHKNLLWLDNSPSNLQYLCPKCHANVHSSLEQTLKKEGKDLESIYPDDFKPILQVLNKNLQ